MMACQSEAKTSHWIHDGLPPASSHFSLVQQQVQLQGTKDFHGVSWGQDNWSQREDDDEYSPSSKLNTGNFSNDCSVITSLNAMQSPMHQNLYYGDGKTTVKTSWSPYCNSSLSVVSEDMPWENLSAVPERDNASSSSSLGCASGVSSLSTSEDALGETEVQSSYTGPLGSLSSLEDALPFKRGLSGFFSGKSRSFSCLADVSSVKDLPKAESPYAKRRRILSASFGNSNRSRFHPIRTTSGIVKKNPHSNSKCTLSLALALSSEESLLENEEVHSPSGSGIPRWKSKSLPSRSFSLSDLQRAGHHYPSH